MSSEGQTRRQFCAHACQAASLAALGGALGSILQGCGSGNPAGPGSGGNVKALPTVTATISGNTVAIPVDASSPLAVVGGAALVQTPAGDLLVAHVSAESFTALTATCTHQACTITGFGSGVFVCPCHGSEFSTSGQVVNGPASVPLAQFQTQITNGVLTVTI